MDPDRRDAAQKRPWAHARLGAHGVHQARRARRGAANLIRHEAVNAALLTLGAMLAAVGFNLFLVPGDLAPGGVSGLTLVVKQLVALPVPNGVLMMILNVPLLYLGYRTLGGTTFVVRTVYVVVVMTVSIDVTAPMLPAGGITEDGLLNALYGGGLMGAANAMIIRAFGNMGGTGIVARLIQRFNGVPIGQIYLLSDGAIVVLLGAVFGWEHALYSMVAVFVAGMVTDYGIEGPSIVRTVFIVTDHPNEVAEALQVRLRTGVTSWEGKGMYRGGQRTVLFCTVNRAEVRELGRIVREADHHGFMVIGQGQRASGGTIGQSDAPG
ncbi:MAG: YitT family protein [Trueperaceae bacterium]|nr:YitT family protein [Trueperaceae bacterium]